MGQGDGYSVLTDSGRTPLAVLLGDTGEIEREVDAALGRLTTAANDDAVSAEVERAPGNRGGRGELGRPPPRHHASAIGSRIQELAEEAYAQELRKAREDERSGKFAILPGQPGAAPRLRSAEEEALANLPWALRQHLVPQEQTQDRPFLLGAVIGALIALTAGSLTFVAIYGWSSAADRTVAPSASGMTAPDTTATASVEGAGVSASHGSRSHAGESAAPLTAVASLPPTSVGTPALSDPSSAIVKAQDAVAAAPAAAPMTPKEPAAAPMEPAKVVAPKARARVVKPVALAAKQKVEESEMTFEDSATTPVEAAAAAAPEDTTPPPSEQEMNDEFERTFGDGSSASAGQDGARKPSVFIPPPVAQLPRTLKETEVLGVVVTHKAQIADCVNAHAGDSPDRRTLVMNWVIAPSGAVEQVKIDSQDHQGSPLAACVRDAIAGWKFAPHLDPQPVRFPFAY